MRLGLWGLGFRSLGVKVWGLIMGVSCLIRALGLWGLGVCDLGV